MNPGEISEAVEQLALEPFDRAEFPFQFLRAFGNKDTAIQRLRAGNTNQSDIPGAVLQRGNIHIASCAPGRVGETLSALRDSPKTISQKAKFILATDGEEFQAEDMSGGGTVVCSFTDFPDARDGPAFERIVLHSLVPTVGLPRPLSRFWRYP